MKDDKEIDERGYLRFKDSKKFVHIWVAEEKYGKEAVKNHEVHHLDGNKLNNRKENLILLSKEDHFYLHDYLKQHEKKEGMLELKPWARNILLFTTIYLIISGILPVSYFLVYIVTIAIILIVLVGGIKQYSKENKD